jgi:electron transfer flavoprotein beta subunit
MKDPKIIVCIKQVPDPEGPPSAFEVNSEAKKVTPVGIPPVINPFDENALEAALKIKDGAGGNVIAISMVEKPATPVLRKALAVGADELIILEDEQFRDLDSYSTAYVLSAAIKKIGGYDIILAGRQAADWDFGQVGCLIAEILNIPSIYVAKSVKAGDGNVVVEKLKRFGYEVVKAPMPVLITASSEIGDLRLPSLNAIKDARGKPVTVWRSTDLEIDPHKLETRKIYRLSPPPSRKRDCVFIDGQSPQEKGEALAVKLREDKVI